MLILALSALMSLYIYMVFIQLEEEEQDQVSLFMIIASK